MYIISLLDIKSLTLVKINELISSNVRKERICLNYTLITQKVIDYKLY